MKDGITYMDYTRKFPVRSFNRMVTMFIMYNWNSNSILSEAIPNKKDKTIIREFKEKIKYLTNRGFKPRFNIFDIIIVSKA